MRQRRVSSWREQWTCVGGTCAPEALPAENGFERLLDAYTGMAAPILRGCYSVLFAGAVFLASLLSGGPAGLWISAVYFVAFAAYCLANFARCREAHCVVTGCGWTVVGVASLVGALLGRPSLGEVWIAFAVVAVLGHGFEGAWRATRGTNAFHL